MLTDPLTLALWEARANARTLGAPNLGDGRMNLRRAQHIAEELYAETAAAGASQVGFKLIATDQRGQAWLGTPGPLSAPVFSSSVLQDGAVIRLDELISPRVELEIGFRFRGDRPRPLACVEIADSRYPDWNVTACEAIADFGLQGLMMFGRARDDISAVNMELVCDGKVVAAASRTIAAASASLACLGERELAAVIENDFAIAAGSVTDVVPLAVGSWRADFGPLGALTFDVTP
jgi:2-keto-4-pentenoate hydratase